MAYRKTTWSLVIILFVTLFLDWFVIETKEQTGWKWLFENPLFLVLILLALAMLIFSLINPKAKLIAMIFTALLVITFFLIPIQRFNVELFTNMTFFKVVLKKFIQWPFYLALAASVILLVLTILNFRKKANPPR